MDADRLRFSVTPAAAALWPLLLLYMPLPRLAALLGAMLVHEGGHALALLLAGERIQELRLELAGLCLTAGVPPSPCREALCALAGPLCGLLWAWLAARLGLTYAAGLSLLLSLFNLLPAPPLDGGRALLALTGQVGLLRVLGGLCAAGLLLCGIHYKFWLLLLPALWLWLGCLKS